jgi:phosphopantothenoylcysteine synthetase/decarboxylase
MNLRVVLTAGGTTESIDDVRTLQAVDIDGGSEEALRRLTHYDISNISKGRFAVEIAKSLHAISPDVDVTIIGRWDLVSELKQDQSKAWLRLVPFRSFTDLAQAVKDEISRSPIDIFLMAAAVSDYSPVAIDGKISSDKDELVIRLRKNPKLLTSLREDLGESTILVGFKLLSGVSHEQLIEVARNQVMRCKCDFTVANDAARINWITGWHPISLVSAEKEEWHVEGPRSEGAAVLARHLIEAVKHSRSSKKL